MDSSNIIDGKIESPSTDSIPPELIQTRSATSLYEINEYVNYI
jgi:hypothetical protein